METFVCKKCKKTFARAYILKNHIEGNACKKCNYNCKLCAKGFTTETSMYRHMRKSCKTKKKEETLKNEIYNTLIKNVKEEMEEKLKIQEKEINELTKKIITLESKETKKCIITKGNNNTINTGTVHNTTNNIVIVGHGKEDMSKIDSADILKVLKNGYNSTIHLTETVHFNPKYPEFQNVYISNMKDKYAMMYDGKKWMLITKEALIDKIYNNKRNFIEENLDKFVESLPKQYVKSLNRWLDTDEEDPRITQIKSDIKLLLYNSRDIPLNAIKDTMDPEIEISNINIIKPNTKKIIKSNKCVENKKIIILDESDETDDTENSVIFARSEPYTK